MQTRIISIIVGILLIAGVGSSVYLNKKPAVLPVEDTTVQTPTSTKTSNTTPSKKYESDEDNDDDEGGVTSTPVVTPKPTTTPTTTSSGITLTTIAKHNSSASCWSTINGSVYDLTSWIPNHPGGSQAILSLCGIDGSAGYNNQHGGSGKPARILAGFKLGALAK